MFSRFSFFLMLFFCLPSFSFSSLSEEDKIMMLLDAIKKSNATFIRGDDRHSSNDAFNHLKRKYRLGMLNPFSPSKEEWTLDFFIENIASKSSTTGESYYIEIDGKKTTTNTWLNKKKEELFFKKTPPG